MVSQKKAKIYLPQLCEKDVRVLRDEMWAADVEALVVFGVSYTIPRGCCATRFKSFCSEILTPSSQLWAQLQNRQGRSYINLWAIDMQVI